MSKPKLEERLEALRQLRSAAPGDAVEDTLRKSLSDKANLIVAEAARIVAQLHLSSLIPELLTTFDRHFKDPVKTDSKCWGKIAIIRALTHLEYDQSPPFIRGARHVQMEPVWGGQEDAAVQFRATCVLGLVQCTDLTRSEILGRLVDALADTADPVRLEAIRAIEQMNGDEAGLLLRLKARLGDARSPVNGQVFDSLLNLESDRAVPFIAEFLRSPDPSVRDEAALALGASRSASAIQVLVDAWKETKESEFRATLLRSISSSRQPQAIDFLVEIIRSGLSGDVAAALEAFSMHEISPDIQSRIEQAKRERAEL